MFQITGYLAFRIPGSLNRIQKSGIGFRIQKPNTRIRDSVKSITSGPDSQESMKLKKQDFFVSSRENRIPWKPIDNDKNPFFARTNEKFYTPVFRIEYIVTKIGTGSWTIRTDTFFTIIPILNPIWGYSLC